MITLKVILSLTLFVLGIGTASAATDSFWIDTQISELIRMPDALTKPRPLLYVAPDTSLNTCKAYLEAKPQWNPETSDFVMSQYAVYDYFVCDALAWVGVAESSGVNGRKAFGRALCDQLDISSFLNSNSEAFRYSEIDQQKAGINLKAAGIGRPRQRGNWCEIDDPETYFSLRAVLHVADSNANKRFLWVWIVDDILAGSYRSRFTQWFEWSPKAQRWKAMKTPPLP